MPLRIGFDVDGVFADFARAFRETGERLFGPGPEVAAGQPEAEEEAQEATVASPREARRSRDDLWRAIRSTKNFWETLKPTEEGAAARLHALMLTERWEVFFITQRPDTDGDTVQRQTQRWLVTQGFDLPSVLVLGGSRGAAARALRLDYHVDDSAQNCFDVISESRARPILIVPASEEQTIERARKLGIGTAQTIPECLDILEQASLAQTRPGLLARLATLVGWSELKNTRP